MLFQQFKGRFPKITSRQEQDSIISALDWSTKVKEFPDGAPFFLPKDTTRLDIHSTIEKKLSQNGLNAPEPTYLITGKLNDFDINFGIGRGDSNAADSWIAKAIIAFPFK